MNTLSEKVLGIKEKCIVEMIYLYDCREGLATCNGQILSVLGDDEDIFAELIKRKFIKKVCAAANGGFTDSLIGSHCRVDHRVTICSLFCWQLKKSTSLQKKYPTPAILTRWHIKFAREYKKKHPRPNGRGCSVTRPKASVVLTGRATGCSGTGSSRSSAT